MFVMISDKVISVPESDFFFDFVRHLTEWLRRAHSREGESGRERVKPGKTQSSRQSRSFMHVYSFLSFFLSFFLSSFLLSFLLTGGPQTFSYQVFFMKKLWLNTVIGKDRKADAMFHYMQSGAAQVPPWIPQVHKGRCGCSGGLHLPCEVRGQPLATCTRQVSRLL